MDLTDLKIYKDFYIFRNLTEVSKRNYITQPSVSYRLSKIQEELKSKLYIYNGEYVFTENGEKFYEYCKRTLDDFEELSRHMLTKEPLTVNLSSAAVFHYLDKLYKQLHNYRLNIEFTLSESAVKNLVEGRALFSIIGGLNLELPKFIEKKTLKTEKVVLVFHNTLNDDIKDIPIVLDERSSGLYKLEVDYLDKFENVQIAAEIGTSYEKLGLVNSNEIGIFISKEYVLNDIDRYKNIAISKRYGFSREIYMLYHRKNRDNHIIRDIIECLL